MTSQIPLLETKSLEVGIAGKCFCNHLDLTLYPGECLGILGQNGAGKSTLLSVLAGLKEPLSGEVLIDGASYRTLGARRSAQIRGWLPQAGTDAFAATVLETAMVGRHPHLDRWSWESADDLQIVRKALAAVDLTDFEERDIQTLSGGERQRLAIATLLAQSPSLYLLDEPTAYLDLKHQMSVLSLLLKLTQSGNTGIAMILHDPALVWRFCDRALLIYGDGMTEVGPVREMLTVERLSALYQYPLEALECKGQVSFMPAQHSNTGN